MNFCNLNFCKCDFLQFHNFDENMKISDLSEGSIIDIVVPHPRNDDFISDPTHIRPITDILLSLYDKELNLRWTKDGAANSPLALIHNVNFKIIKKTLFLEKDYEKKFNAGTITREELDKDIKLYNNVVKQNHFTLKVIKS